MGRAAPSPRAGPRNGARDAATIDRLRWAMVAVVADLLIFLALVASGLTAYVSPVIEDVLALALLILPVVAVVGGVVAMVSGHGTRDPRARTAFWLGLLALIPAAGWLLLLVVAVVVVAQTEGW